MAVATVGRASPALATGTELLGLYKGSGRVEAPYIVRRLDGQMLEISPLLHHLAATLDPARDLEWVAAHLSTLIGRPIGTASVEYLVEHKLRPLGMVAEAAQTGPPPPSTPALLGLTVHAGVVPPHAVRACTTVLRPLFLPPVVVGVLAGLAGADVWLWRSHRLGGALHHVLTTPALLLMVVAFTIVAAGFHELGHATASRYGGAEPGVIGAGIYLIWPVFYNDLHDSHRLDRAGRLRCDLGGVYFNVVVILATFGAFGLTGFAPLLVVVLAQHLAILQQFLPFVRLDGYYVVSDLAGVPDLFGRIRPIMSGLLPGRPAGRGVRDLKPGARAIVTAWVLVTLPLLTAAVLFLGFRMPSLVADTARSLAANAGALVDAAQAGQASVAALKGLQLLALAVPVVGLTATVAGTVRRCHGARIPRRLGSLVLRFGAPR